MAPDIVKKETIIYQDYRDRNTEDLLDAARSADLVSIYGNDELLNAQIWLFNGIINDIFEKHVPLRVTKERPEYIPYLIYGGKSVRPR